MLELSLRLNHGVGLLVLKLSWSKLSSGSEEFHMIKGVSLPWLMLDPWLVLPVKWIGTLCIGLIC
jgi:hypothetical protein